MGLFDRMLTDLVVGSTGLNARSTRRMVRRIGTRNLLMMGAAAALGGLAVSKAGGTPPPPGSVPLPPVPGTPRAGSRSQPLPESSRSSRSGPTGQPVGPGGAAGAPPPLPPLPTVPAPPTEPDESAEPAELPPEALFPAVRTMVAAALADGELGTEERRLILARLDQSDLPEAHAHQVHQDLVVPPAPAELAAMVTDPGARETLYRAAALVVLADRRVTDRERAWLESLAVAFGFDPDTRKRLEAELFAGDEG
jgi:hypothetical protein